MPHVQGSWDSATLTLEPAQIFILVNVFGFRRKVDDRRRFTRAYIEVARKNATSTLTAGIALYCLTCENELGPEIIIGATTGAQADKVTSEEHTSELTSIMSISCSFLCLKKKQRQNILPHYITRYQC